MTQLSGVAAAVKDEQRVFLGRQLVFELVEFAIGYADGGGNVAFVIFGTFGPRIDDHQRLFFIQFTFYIGGFHTGVIPLHLHPGRKTVGKDFDIGVTEFLRFPSGFVTQFSGGAAAVKDEQAIFVCR